MVCLQYRLAVVVSLFWAQFACAAGAGDGGVGQEGAAKAERRPALRLSRERFGGEAGDHCHEGKSGACRPGGQCLPSASGPFSSPIGGFADRWFYEMRHPTICPVVLCGGTCGGGYDSCTLNGHACGQAGSCSGSPRSGAGTEH